MLWLGPGLGQICWRGNINILFEETKPTRGILINTSFLFSITPLEKENYTVTVSRNDAPLPFFLVKSQCFADDVSFLINYILGAHEAGDAET